MKKESEYLSQTYSYLALRKAVGWIGILLPFVLVPGAFVLFGCKGVLVDTLSWGKNNNIS